ncbi:MAG TPA: glucose-1-phosphate adenylyltransferase, partial [Pseudothermotoga sp.]
IHGTVENSVIFQGVYVGENAVIRNSVIMTGTCIEKDCLISDAIVAERVIVRERVIIGQGEPAFSRLDKEVYSDHISVIGMYSKIPPDVVIGKNCVIGIGVTERDFESATLESGGYILHKE